MTGKTKNLIVGFPLYDGVNMMDFAGASEVFADTLGLFTPIWLAAEKREIRTSSGNSVYPNFSFTDNYPPIDILFIPGVVYYK
jgi:transcriptional regulator GlxA family with amidase domain